MTTIERKKRHLFFYQMMECFLTLLCVGFSYVLAGQMIYHNGFPFGILSGLLIYTVVSVLSVLCFGANRYFCIKEKPMPETVTIMFAVSMLINLVFVALLYFTYAMKLSIYFFVIADTLQIGSLFICKLYFTRYKQGILSERKVLVIGKSESENEIMKAVLKAGLCRICFADYRDEDFEKYMNIADVIFMSGELPKRLKDYIVSVCLLLEKDIYLVPEAYEISLRKSRLTQVGDVPVFNIEPYKLSEAQKFIKRIMDICGAAMGLILTSPIMLVFAVLIKSEDGGAVFYKQIRSGRGGREFQVMKFRSMRVDAEKFTGAVFAAEKDPRITKIGAFMRATRIDEIPQFINVLRGDMSLIGPRPERPVFVEKFCKEIPEYKNRLAVKPGITGLAQVLGNYTTTAVNKARFDMVYIQEYSLMLDIKILFKTVKVVLTKEQAAGFVESAKDGLDQDKGSNRFTSFMPLEQTEDGCGSLQKTGGKGSFRRAGLIRAFKTVLVATCCFVVISASLMFRYVSFAAEAFHNSAVEVASADGLVGPSGGVSLDGVETSMGYQDNVSGGSLNNQSPQSLVGELDLEIGNAENAVGGEPMKESESPSIPSKAVNTGQQTTNSMVSPASVAKTTKEQIAISEENIQKAIEGITFRDKVDAVYMLVTRLKSEDIIQLEEMSRGGFTVEEKAIAKEMVYKYYTEEEIKKIYGLYVEYVR